MGDLYFLPDVCIRSVEEVSCSALCVAMSEAGRLLQLHRETTTPRTPLKLLSSSALCTAKKHVPRATTGIVGGTPNFEKFNAWWRHKCARL
jgi:hypothetical protein